jgi:hypothetical protein
MKKVKTIVGSSTIKSPSDRETVNKKLYKTGIDSKVSSKNQFSQNSSINDIRKKYLSVRKNRARKSPDAFKSRDVERSSKVISLDLSANKTGKSYRGYQSMGSGTKQSSRKVARDPVRKNLHLMYKTCSEKFGLSPTSYLPLSTKNSEAS